MSVYTEAQDLLSRLMVVVKERNEARAEVEMLRAEVDRLRWANEMGCENTPNPDCQCPGCETARDRADRGETGP